MTPQITFVDAETTVLGYVEEIALAPLNHPEILPSALPLILAGVALELYFGKHKQESLGWNSSLANAVIWIATGITLLISGDIENLMHQYVSYFLIGLGVLTGYMDFYHKWPKQVAFVASSAISVYSIAYVTLVMVKTGIPVNPTTLKAAGAFIVGITLFFQIIKLFEQPARNDGAALPN